MKRLAKVGDMVRAPDGKYWVVSYALHRAVEDEVLLICHRDGQRRTWRRSACVAVG
jgi:hypothetical protein